MRLSKQRTHEINIKGAVPELLLHVSLIKYHLKYLF